jgi:predicted GTPase
MVDKIVPKDIKLTSFSVVLARMKGAFEQYLKGTPYLDKLKDGDKVLMLESCTHQPTCEDIGRVKLPAWITKYTGKKLEFSAVSGLSDIGSPLTDYAMIIQCGGCVATAAQIRNRLLPALENNVPVSNYGLVIAYIHGIFDRATEIFK